MAAATERTGAARAAEEPSATAASTGVAAGIRQYLTSNGPLPAIVALAVVGMFVPAVVVPYAFADDYSYLWMVVSGEPNPQFGETVFQANAVNGRPLAGVLLQIAFGAADTIEGLRSVRAGGVLGLVVLALMFHRALVRSAVPAGAAALIAVFMCSMPAFQVYGSWAVLFAAPWAALLGGVASMVATRAADAGGELRLRAVAVAAAVLLGGLFIYQPAAMCFWVFLGIALVGRLDEPKRAVRVAWVHGVVAGAALLAAYAQARLAIAYYGDAAPASASERASVSFDVIGRARWFVEQPLYQASGLFDLTPTAWGAAVAGAVAGGGMLAWLVLRTPRWWVFAGLAAALVPLSYLPNLVVEETPHPYRTQAALSALLALYVALGVLAWWRLGMDWIGGRLNRDELRLARWTAWGGAIGVVAVGCVIASSNIANLMAGPQMTELRLLRWEVRDVPADAPRVTFVGTNWYGGMTDRVYNDELGLPSSARPFAIRGIVQLISREEGRLVGGYGGPVIDYYLSGSTQFPPDQPVIDVRWMRALR